MIIRDAVAADIERVTEIYNEVLLSSTAIFNDRPATVEERHAYWQEHVSKSYPLLVAERDGVVQGYATFGDFRSWPGYRFTVEGTIHIHRSARRQGVGQVLMAELLVRAKSAGKHVIMAGVDAANEASLTFLAGVGFERVGHLREVGHKFGRYLDLVFLQRML